MKIFDKIKSKFAPAVTQHEEIRLLNIELDIARSEYDYIEKIISDAKLLEEHNYSYMLHKRECLAKAKVNLDKAKANLKAVHLVKMDEERRQADAKAYERRRAAEINSKSKLRMLERVMIETLGVDVAQGVIDEASERLNPLAVGIYGKHSGKLIREPSDSELKVGVVITRKGEECLPLGGRG